MPDRPNILVLMTDQQRADAMHCAGNPHIRTPYLDALCTYSGPDRVPTEEACRTVNLNDGPWPKRLPEDEKDRVETFAEAFTRAISKETTLSPDKLSIEMYKKKCINSAPATPAGNRLKARLGKTHGTMPDHFRYHWTF